MNLQNALIAHAIAPRRQFDSVKAFERQFPKTKKYLLVCIYEEDDNMVTIGLHNAETRAVNWQVNMGTNAPVEAVDAFIKQVVAQNE